jgi:hypothetical protein
VTAALLAVAGRALAWLRGLSTVTRIVVAGLVAMVLTLAAHSCARPPPPRLEERREATTEAHQVVTADRRETEAATRHVETRTERRPDGVVTVVRIEDSRRDAAAATATASTVEVREVVREVRVVEAAPRPSWRASLAAGWRPGALDLAAAPPVLRAELARRIAGPVSVGLWTQYDRPRRELAAGLSLAVEW